jgi:hypothetical protein
MVVCVCDPSYVGGIGRRILSEASPEQKHETLSGEITKAKKGWSVAQVVECLLIKCKT